MMGSQPRSGSSESGTEVSTWLFNMDVSAAQWGSWFV